MDLEDRLASPTQRLDSNTYMLGSRCWRCLAEGGNPCYIDLCDSCYEELRS